MDLVNKGIALEDAVVSVIRIDGDTMFQCNLFKVFKSNGGVSGIEGHLVLNVDVARCGIPKDGVATVSIILLFPAGCVENATLDAGL